MSTNFSAGPQALGYLFQARYSLYLILRDSRPDISVWIEHLDDVDLNTTSGELTLTQLKHQITRPASLTDTSADLWKTLRIWCTQLSERRWDPHGTNLHLVTTGTAPLHSAAWYLKESPDRDTTRADELLLTAATESQSQDAAMQKSFNCYRDLTDPERMSLLNAIKILDESPNILDVGQLIRQQIRAAAPPEEAKQAQVQEQLEGWWFDIVVKQLAGHTPGPIHQVTVFRKLWAITEEMQPQKLPILYADATPETAIDAGADDRLFVQQLRVLKISTERIQRAILDYYRAFEQRSSWVADHFLITDDITKYERRLIDEWQAVRIALEDGLSSDAEELACVNVGKQILSWMETQANIPIRTEVVDRFVMRGSFHILANENKPRVYWHPRFVERVQSILMSE